MKLSTKTEYGIRALVHLAECEQDRPYPLQQIAEKENLPYSFLEKIFQDLKIAGLVRSQRGVSGGYCLAKPYAEISVKEIMEALDGEMSMFKELVTQKQRKTIHCQSHIILAALERKIHDSLHAVHLSDLIKQTIN